jgi:mRNA interferase MazF
MSSISSTNYVPDSGHVIWLDFTPQAGFEMQGPHPALVLSPMLYNRKILRDGSEFTLALICPITSTRRNSPYEVVLPQSMSTTGVILSDQIKSQDWKARKARFIEIAADDILADVMTRILTILPPFMIES